MIARPRLLLDDAAGRSAAIAALRRGNLVALPTDTRLRHAVALDAIDGIERLFAAKRRPPQKGVGPVCSPIIARPTRLPDWTRPRTSSPPRSGRAGPTPVLQQRPDVLLPAALTSGALNDRRPTPAHAALRTMDERSVHYRSLPANRSGEPDATDAAGVLAQFRDALDLEIVLDGGAAPAGVPSSVVDCSAGPARLLRAGVIPLGSPRRRPR